MSHSAQQLSVALLFVGAIALGATAYLGSPWPGVALCGLAVVPWGVGVWLVQRAVTQAANGQIERLSALEPMMVDAAMSTKAAHERIGRMQEELNSLRSAASLRGTLGG